MNSKADQKKDRPEERDNHVGQPPAFFVPAGAWKHSIMMHPSGCSH